MVRGCKRYSVLIQMTLLMRARHRRIRKHLAKNFLKITNFFVDLYESIRILVDKQLRNE